jgi:hypothetical protein
VFTPANRKSDASVTPGKVHKSLKAILGLMLQITAENLLSFLPPVK